MDDVVTNGLRKYGIAHLFTLIKRVNYYLYTYKIILRIKERARKMVNG